MPESHPFAADRTSRGAVIPVAEVLAEIATARDATTAAADALRAVELLMGARDCFVAVPDGEHVAIAAHHGIARADLEALCTGEALHTLVTTWRDRPIPSQCPEQIRGWSGTTVVCAPIVTGSWAGLIGATARPEDAHQVGDALAVIGRHLGAAVTRLALVEDAGHREAEIDGVIQTIPHPILATDGDGVLVRLNPPACELFGLTPSFSIGRHIRGVLGVPQLEAMLLGEDDRYEVQLDFGAPARAYRAVVGRVYDGRRCLERIVALEDVSVIHETIRAKDDFIAVMGHELRTPLTILTGFTQTLAVRGDTLGDDQRQHFLDAISTQTSRLARLVEDLLFLAGDRLGDRPAFALFPFDLGAAVESVVTDIGGRMPDRTISVDVPGDLITVSDRFRVEQVVRHLVENALKFSDGAVRVVVTADGDRREIAVEDSGPGIAAGDLDRVFEPFVQADSSTTRRHGGAGVGLYIARRLSELLGGTLTCHSRLGAGSRFLVRLPRDVPDRPDSRRPTRGSDRLATEAMRA